MDREELDQEQWIREMKKDTGRLKIEVLGSVRFVKKIRKNHRVHYHTNAYHSAIRHGPISVNFESRCKDDR